MLDRTPLHIDVVQRDATTVALVLSGDLDHDSVAQLAALTFAAGYRRIDMDLSALSFIDSSGLAALLRLHEQAAGVNAALHVVALTPYLRGLFTMTALDRVFTLPPG
ncbi:anti-anti-sigma factor [Nonomuraea solani]|uniref:Anti-anti-sigma factor n=1 Tax=Nonomuraea solani TaxID=1144553 RepID=A0A1H6F2C4_9ACTN|nr:STAS domain-containing protein [Nonomuraea solani]SEH03359.1 anti-anti-sigma factor [Nonomuraea solani]